MQLTGVLQISSAPKLLPWSMVLARGSALFLGLFSLLNLVGSLRVPGFDLNLWWIDLRMLPGWLADPFLAASGILLAWFGLRPAGSQPRRGLTCACLCLLLVISAANCLTYYTLVLRHAVRPALPIPLSLLVVTALALVLRQVLRRPLAIRAPGWLPALAAAGLLAIGFAFAQMVLFGKTDYRRQADVAVVLGARVYQDGRLSDALQDRVRTACALYRQGLVGKLIMSGGPGDGRVHETDAMARCAVALGVREADILRDESGLNTDATVKNTRAIFRSLRASRVLVVSHGYHLPRVKLAYQRAGLEVYTVPARESYFLRQMPYNMAREAAAIWVYYFRPLVSG